MAKELLTRDKVKEKLRKQIKNTIPKTVFLSIPFIVWTWISVELLILTERDWNSFINPYAAMAVILSVVILPIAYPLYLYISLIAFQIRASLKIKKNKFTISEDEIDYIREMELINFRLRFRYKLVLGANMWHSYYDVIYLKKHGRYLVMGNEDGIVRMSSAGDKVYVVHYEGINEPVLVYTGMIYEYKEEKH